MTSIARQRCVLHPGREAVALCPECGKPYCRECVTEHDDRIICASCLREAAMATKPGAKKARTRWLRPLVTSTVGFVALWFIFYMTGQALLRLPSSFHEGTLWKPELFEPVDEG